ncbi:hypothetical protein SHO565_52290 [Streptomyces sp. HO565]
MAIRVNQVGQMPGEKKFAHVMGGRDTLADAEFEVLDERGERPGTAAGPAPREDQRSDAAHAARAAVPG